MSWTKLFLTRGRLLKDNKNFERSVKKLCGFPAFWRPGSFLKTYSRTELTKIFRSPCILRFWTASKRVVFSRTKLVNDLKSRASWTSELFYYYYFFLRFEVMDGVADRFSHDQRFQWIHKTRERSYRKVLDSPKWCRRMNVGLVLARSFLINSISNDVKWRKWWVNENHSECVCTVLTKFEVPHRALGSVTGNGGVERFRRSDRSAGAVVGRIA